MTRLDASSISDLVPTHSDELTRQDLAVLFALRMTTEQTEADESVFAEPTLELYVDHDVTVR